MRTIDADALIEKCGDWYVEEGTESGFIGTLKNLLATEPTIQPEKAQLSQEGTTSDLISRQAARHALCKAVHKGEDIPCENQTASCLWTGTRVCDFVREIDALPTIQPEPHEGHWINGKCDRCGEHAPFWAMASTYHESNYCPNCGSYNGGGRK